MLPVRFGPPGPDREPPPTTSSAHSKAFPDRSGRNRQKGYTVPLSRSIHEFTSQASEWWVDHYGDVVIESPNHFITIGLAAGELPAIIDTLTRAHLRLTPSLTPLAVEVLSQQPPPVHDLDDTPVIAEHKPYLADGVTFRLPADVRAYRRSDWEDAIGARMNGDDGPDAA